MWQRKTLEVIFNYIIVLVSSIKGKNFKKPDTGAQMRSKTPSKFIKSSCLQSILLRLFGCLTTSLFSETGKNFKIHFCKHLFDTFSIKKTADSVKKCKVSWNILVNVFSWIHFTGSGCLTFYSDTVPIDQVQYVLTEFCCFWQCPGYKAAQRVCKHPKGNSASWVKEYASTGAPDSLG